ncbi:MAG: VOC family protein [Microbacteriaceae bacterium]
MPVTIGHIGIIVGDLENAIERWSAVTGYTFSEISRYRTDRYCDHSEPTPHHHDARIALSVEGEPHIELMEFTGEGTHSAKHGEGFHHFGFTGTVDLEGRMAELRALGVRHDGRSFDPEGRLLLWFTDRDDLNGIRLEYVSPATPPIVTDAGQRFPLLPDGMVDIFRGAAPTPGFRPINHFGVMTADIERARERWSAVTGWRFGPVTRYRTPSYVDRSDPRPHLHDARTSMTLDGPPHVELMEFHGSGTHSRAQGEGLHHVAFVDDEPIEPLVTAVHALGIGEDGRASTPAGDILLSFTHKPDLNGIRLEFVTLAFPHPIYSEAGELLGVSDPG